MKFQKAISIWLGVLLLVSQLGLTMNMHYCGKEIRSVDFSTTFSKPKKDKSCCGVQAEKSSCCKNKKVLLQKKVDSNLQKSFSLTYIDFVAPTVVQTVFVPSVAIRQSNAFLAHYCDANGPPLYQLYSQYIFYEIV